MDELKNLDRIPQGSVIPPPSKSISHRVLICAALANGMSRIGNIAFSEDVRATLNCIEALNIHYAYDGEMLTIYGSKNSLKRIRY